MPDHATGISSRAVAVILIGLMTGSAFSQSPDLLILGQYGTALYGVQRSVVLPTFLHNANLSYSSEAMIAGPGDDSVYLFSQHWNPSSMPALLFQADSNSATTVANFGLNRAIIDAQMDDAGDFLVIANSSSSTYDGIYSARIGSSSLNRIAAFPAGLFAPIAFTEDPGTGDWYVLGSTGWLHRVVRTGGIQVSLARLPALFGLDRYYDLLVDPKTDEILYCASRFIIRFDPRTKSVTTMVDFWGQRFHDFTFDPLSRRYLVCGEEWSQNAWKASYGEITENGYPLHMTRMEKTIWFVGIRPTHGRVFTPKNPPARGKTHSILFRSHAEPGVRYQAAFAFAHRPGIHTPFGTIPLALDPLFLLSVAGLPGFNHLRGRLDATGSTVLGVDIPPLAELRGVRVHLAAVTYDNQAIRSIFGPHSFSIR